MPIDGMPVALQMNVQIHIRPWRRRLPRI